MNEKSEEDKLVELKEMLIGFWILENRSDDDWKKYEKRNDVEWIEREGLEILLTEEMLDLMVDKREDGVLEIFDYFILPSSVSSRAVQCSMIRLCNSVSDRVGGDGWKGLRVLCWVVGWMVEGCENECSDKTIDCVMNYLVKVIDECEEMEMVKWAILTGEKLWVEMKMNSERRDRLRTAFTRHSQTHSDTLVLELGRLDLWDAERYQVGWCAKWCVDNLVENEMGLTSPVKLSPDRFDVRCDDRYPTPVRSPFPVKSNVYFYEVNRVTNGEIKLGWSTRKARFDDSYISIKNEKNSVMLQVGNQCTIHHNNHHHPIPNPPSPSPLNVFGCLLDVDNRRFEFYINGRALDCPITAHFSPPYFATVRLSPHQQCHFNFGQCPFKFPPRNIRFTTFHEQTGGDERKYRLVETEKWGFGFLFLHPPVDNKVSLFFDDAMQNEVNREVRGVERDVENDRVGQWKWNGEMKKGLKWLRYIQAIIEVMGNVVRVDKVDLMAQWIGQVIEDVIDRVHKEKLLELLYPYLHFVITQSNLTQHRSICIVLLHLIKCFRHYGYDFEEIHSSVFTYLTRTLTSSPDQWTQLFVLIAFVDLGMSEHEKRQIEGCGKIRKIVEKCTRTFEGKDVGQLIKSVHKYSLQYQLYLCSQKLLNSINTNPTNTNPATPATLNPHDLTPQLTLSPCHLSARSDWHWQSVRSVCQVSAHIYYFEVVLLTAGPMTLGWATKRTDSTKITKIHQKETTPIMFGFDEFCIGFDGFNRCIYHDNKTFQLENIPRWKAGDIVGCLIDKTQSSFKFYLNGIPINFNPTQCPIYFSSQPYHCLISLSQLQQVYLNFGQSPFSSHRPKYIDFCDFYSDKPEVNEIQTKNIVNFHNANLERNLIAIDANINQRDVTITGNASTSKRSAESTSKFVLLILNLTNLITESIGNISSVSTIANVNFEQVNNSQIDRKRSSSVTLCDICQQPQSTKRLRFECCDHLKFCLNCAHVLGNCRKCLAEKQNRSQHR